MPAMRAALSSLRARPAGCHSRIFCLALPRRPLFSPAQSTIDFRANTFDLFVQDNWRAGKNLTLNLGVRYEYVTPITELNNQLVNLDVAPDFSAVAPVLPGQIGPITGQKFPSGLVNPDRNNFAPRLGVAWKPLPKTVVRAGYGMNYNIGQYGQMATQLGFQPPFAVAQTNPAATTTSLTLQNGFPASASGKPATTSPTHTPLIPNYRLPYVQSWNLNIQQEIKTSVVVNIGYTGSKGTHLDIVRAPDQLATGGPRFTPCTPTTPADVACVQPFLYESSEGSSILHQGTLRVRKRMRHGLLTGRNVHLFEIDRRCVFHRRRWRTWWRRTIWTSRRSAAFPALISGTASWLTMYTNCRLVKTGSG